MSFTPVQLASELHNDPSALGYAPSVASGADGTLVQMLGAGQGGAGGGPSGCVLLRAQVPTSDAIMLVALADWVALTASQQAYLTALAATGMLLLVNPLAIALATPPVYGNLAAIATPLYANLVALFASTTPTGQAFAQTSTRPCSRAEYLWGEGIVVSAEDVAIALRGVVQP